MTKNGGNNAQSCRTKARSMLRCRNSRKLRLHLGSRNFPRIVRLSVNLISEDGLKYATAFCRVRTNGGHPFCKRMPLAIKDPVR